MAKKFFSKALAVGLALALCLSLLPMSAFAAEDGRYCSFCMKHSLVYVPQVDPTCQKEGVVAHYECPDCGRNFHRNEGLPTVYAGKVRRIDKVSCDYSIPATCTSPATCKWCGKADPNGQVDPNNHAADCTLSDWIKNAEGHYKRYSLCGAIVESTSHVPVGIPANPATCEHAGTLAGTRCSVCDYVISGGGVDPQKDHNYSGEYVQSGTGHKQLCVNGCGEYGNREVHSLTWTITEEPTCSEDGEKVGKCVCGYKERRTIPATGEHEYGDNGECDCGAKDPNYKPDHTHAWSEWTEEKTATCTELGKEARSCECGAKEFRNVAMVEHNYQDAEILHAATCNAPGSKTQQCTACGGSRTVEIPVDPEAHAFSEDFINVAIHNQHGHLCQLCGAISGLAAHTWDEGEVTTEATETEDGERTFTCTDCGATRTEPIPATGGQDDNQGGDNQGGDNTGDTGNTGDNTGGTEIDDADIPLGGGEDLPEEPEEEEVVIDDVDVPLGGLMTRAEFVNYLYVREGQPDAQAATFADVPEEHRFSVSIGWAQANGIARGIGDNRFAPDELLTVEQAELFLTRYAQFKGIEMPRLAALADKKPEDILNNADEVLGEFFGDSLPDEGGEAA